MSISAVRHRPLWVRLIALTVLVCMLGLTAACFGQFPLTRLVYDVNKDIGDSALIQTIVFWVFIILPVYGLAQLGDAVIFNLIEFWTGEQPLQVTSADDAVGLQTAMALSEDGRTLTMTVTEDGEVTSVIESTEVSPGTFEVRDAEGTVVGLVERTADGGLELCDAEGTLIETLSADQIAAAL